MLGQMEAEAWIGIGALVVAGIALFFTGMAALATKAQASATKEQASAAIEQTEIQRQIQRDSVQPYVWVDIRPDRGQASLWTIVAGNSGPTVATNVRATFDPPLPRGTLHVSPMPADEAASKQLAEGLPSLAPGREIVWALGAGPDVLSTDEPLRFTITVKADGPFGPVPELRYDVDLHAYRKSLDSPDGTLHRVRVAIDNLAKAIAKG